MAKKSGLFLQLTSRRCGGCFMGIDFPGRYLIEDLAHRIAKLADQHHVPIFKNRKHRRCTGMFYPLASRFRSVGQTYFIKIDVKQAAAKHLPGRLLVLNKLIRIMHSIFFVSLASTQKYKKEFRFYWLNCKTLTPKS